MLLFVFFCLWVVGCRLFVCVVCCGLAVFFFWCEGGGVDFLDTWQVGPCRSFFFLRGDGRRLSGHLACWSVP